jgi:hypothetical protein
MVARLPYDIERDFQPIALIANGMDRPRSRPQRLSEFVGGLSGEGAPPCLTSPPFTQ